MATTSLDEFSTLLTAAGVLRSVSRHSLRCAGLWQQFWMSPPWLLLLSQDAAVCPSRPAGPTELTCPQGAGSSLPGHGQALLSSTSSRKGKRYLNFKCRKRKKPSFRARCLNFGLMGLFCFRLVQYQRNQTEIWKMWLLGNNQLWEEQNSGLRIATGK